MQKVIFKLVSLFLAFFLLTSCYVARSSWEFGKLYSSRKRVDDLIADPNSPSKLVDRLKFLKELLKYAKEQGLNSDGAYAYYIDLKKADSVSFLVEASEAFELKPVTWWFPFVGTVPYLGYFNKKDRDSKAQSLSGQGYDIYLGEASAFSSLGWFEDPIFSNVIFSRKDNMVDTVFHELVHRTIWAKGEVDFNEQLATFIADVMTVSYLKKSGDLKELESHVNKKQDRALFADWLNHLRQDLERFYSQLPKEEKSVLLKKKKEIFDFHLLQKKPRFQSSDYLGRGPWNNATVLASKMYTPDSAALEKALRCSGEHINLFLENLKKNLERTSKPQKALEGLCSQVHP
ncbi:MAG: aminopeptidase [Oligoflexales bacterium]|nr:aminopeptidase [Oligoflexales bacterium]